MNDTYTESVATLENGHTICEPGIHHFLKVGDVWRTQWGPRRVVNVEVNTRDFEPDLAGQYYDA